MASNLSSHPKVNGQLGVNVLFNMSQHPAFIWRLMAARNKAFYSAVAFLSTILWRNVGGG